MIISYDDNSSHEGKAVNNAGLTDVFLNIIHMGLDFVKLVINV